MGHRWSDTSRVWSVLFSLSFSQSHLIVTPWSTPLWKTLHRFTLVVFVISWLTDGSSRERFKYWVFILPPTKFGDLTHHQTIYCYLLTLTFFCIFEEKVFEVIVILSFSKDTCEQIYVWSNRSCERKFTESIRVKIPTHRHNIRRICDVCSQIFLLRRNRVRKDEKGWC